MNGVLSFGDYVMTHNQTAAVSDFLIVSKRRKQPKMAQKKPNQRMNSKSTNNLQKLLTKKTFQSWKNMPEDQNVIAWESQVSCKINRFTKYFFGNFFR